VVATSELAVALQRDVFAYSRLLALNEQLQDEVRSVNTGIQGRARRPPLLRGTSSDEWLQILGNVHNVVRGALGQLNSGFLGSAFQTSSITYQDQAP